MTMSANPRSPESGDEVIDLDNAAEIIRRSCFKIAAAGEPHASYAREMESVAMAGIELRRRYNALEAENARLTAELSTARERADRAEQDSKRLDYLAQWGFVRAGSAWCPDAQEMVGHFEWVQPGCWATLMPMQGRDDAWEQDQYVECDIPLRDAVDAAMKASTPTPTPDHA